MNDSVSRICLLGATGLLITSVHSLFGQVAKESGANATNLEQAITDAAKPNTFIRLKRDAQERPLALQTGITSFRPRSAKTDFRVDLIGAVHIGDKAYYQQLNEAFKTYDVVLYELVAPPGTRIPKGGRQGSGGNPISMLQGMAKDVMNLSSQMQEVDYTQPNLVHADMSPTEMQTAMSKRGETPMTVALDAFSEMMKQTNRRQQAQRDTPPQPAQDPLSLLFDSQRDVKLKSMMAEQFATMGTDMMGGTLNRVLIEDRNAAAMKVLQKQVVKGHQRIAIFYGAAHLPDFAKRLEEDFDLARGETKWLTAWDLSKPSKSDRQDPLNNLLKALLQPSNQ